MVNARVSVFLHERLYTREQVFRRELIFLSARFQRNNERDVINTFYCAYDKKIGK